MQNSHRHPFFAAVVVVVGGALEALPPLGPRSHTGVTPVYVVDSMQ
jgi:hypothetical protein